MNKISRAVLVVACMSLSVIGSQAQAAGLSADQYVRALTEHLHNGGTLDGVAKQNVRQLAAAERNSVDQEDFVELGNALYISGHGDLADLVMQSKTVAPDQYEGAELRVQWPEGVSP